MKKHKVLKIVLLIIFAPIIFLIIAFLVWKFFPIGLNPSNMVFKMDSNSSYIEYNDKIYASYNDGKLLPIQECGLIYKENLPINKVYRSRIKHISQSFEVEYFSIGDNVIIGHCTDVFSSILFKYADSNLSTPNIAVENIKKIEKCEGYISEYFDTSITGASNGCYYSASFHEKTPKDTSVYKFDLTVLETYSEADTIQPLVDLFTQEQEPKWSDEIINGPKRFLYKIEFVDDSFPFYLIVAR